MCIFLSHTAGRKNAPFGWTYAGRALGQHLATDRVFHSFCNVFLYLSLGDFKRLDGVRLPTYIIPHSKAREKVCQSLITQRPGPGNSYQLQSNSSDGFHEQVVIRHLLTYTRPRLR